MNKRDTAILYAYIQAKEALSEAQGLVERASAKATAVLSAIEGASVKTETSEGLYSVVLVSPERVNIDELQLMERLDRSQWQKISKRVLDKPSLEAAVANGSVSMRDVSDCSEVVATKPYLKVTRVKQ